MQPVRILPHRDGPRYRLAMPAPDSFARYLAQVLVAQRGFAEGTVPEAQKLAAAADIVLTKSDGMSISIFCIVDAERDPSRRFGLEFPQVLEIARACRAKYAGRTGSTKMPAVAEIVEVRQAVTG